MPDKAIRKRIVSRSRRIVVKIGTSAICDERGRLDGRVIDSLAGQVAEIMRSGVSVTLVASGAIGAALGELDLSARPRTMPKLQAVAAIGQGQLIRAFHDAFARHDLTVAQVLVTRDAFEDRMRYLNVRNTLRELRDFGALAVINENDAVSVDAIRFGDNDIIAALVANMIDADVLIMLTVVDGVIENGHVLDVIENLDGRADELVTAQRSSLGSGGMATKLQAAGLVTRAGKVAVIANAGEKNVLCRLLAAERIGTVMMPAAREKKMSSRRRWIGQAARTEGKISVDDGAASALTRRGKSLLPSGVTGVSGGFGKGAAVSVVDAAGSEIARGLTNYSAAQIERIKGLKTSQIARVLGDKPYDAVIHRNNMTLVE